MPPTRKRSFRATYLDHGTPPPPKRTRSVEVIILSSDTEVEELPVNPPRLPRHRILSRKPKQREASVIDISDDAEDVAEDDEEDNDEDDEEDDAEGDAEDDEEEDTEDDAEDDAEDDEEDNEEDNDDDDTDESQPHRTLSVLKQLQQDAFNDSKAGLRDNQREPAGAITEPAADDDDSDDDDTDGSQPHRAASVLEQLQQDAFGDLKLDQCDESDDLREPAGAINPAAAAADDDTDGSQPHLAQSVLEQLQQDAFHDFKADLCDELDNLREPAADSRDDDATSCAPLRDVLRQWVAPRQDKASRYTDCLCYRLDHAYNSARGFSQRALVGRDRAVVRTLCRLAGELPFEVFLAVLETETGAGGAAPEDYLVSSLVDLQGNEVVSYIVVDEQNWVQARFGASTSRAAGYLDAAVVLLPRDSVVDFLLRWTEAPAAMPGRDSLEMREVQGLVQYFAARILETDRRDHRLLPIFKELCVRVWQLDEAKGLALLPGSVVQTVLQAVLHAQDWPFFEQVASRLGGQPPVPFLQWVVQEVDSGRLPLQPIQKGYAPAPCALEKKSVADRFGACWPPLSLPPRPLLDIVSPIN
ncbi:uncharacterized protein THITE_2112607 [Thermothielavioides terrestris NRRL 8126]|uniref:Uncharacterized protein n=1 Tax=Thermothielavioides terrestris (strain ATCC 38088 / NRRL 8126) TaxID=578455 RepID=G2QZJ5_THETT|nr:uncharacterized protein THITE_2112607 [Thermothielavioides terrestris NRRL 8126]AEO65521.1 hypothetical protein THITE_2112607 [Thermothielavioides terrestris NRRL 8126]